MSFSDLWRRRCFLDLRSSGHGKKFGHYFEPYFLSGEKSLEKFLEVSRKLAKTRMSNNCKTRVWLASRVLSSAADTRENSKIRTHSKCNSSALERRDQSWKFKYPPKTKIFANKIRLFWSRRRQSLWIASDFCWWGASQKTSSGFVYTWLAHIKRMTTREICPHGGFWSSITLIPTGEACIAVDNIFSDRNLGSRLFTTFT